MWMDDGSNKCVVPGGNNCEKKSEHLGNDNDSSGDEER